MRPFERDYYMNRAAEERTIAATCTNSGAAKVHMDMASRYDAIAQGKNASDEESLKTLAMHLGLTRDRARYLGDVDKELIEASKLRVESSRELLRERIKRSPPLES